jgi:hypothetical protein
MGPLPDGYDQIGYSVYEDETTRKAVFNLNGVQPKRQSISLGCATFDKGNICIGLSKERQGLPLSISRCCDSLIHIPHLPLCGSTPLLDTPSCLSITLAYISDSIGYSERSIHAHKFDVIRPNAENLVDIDVRNGRAIAQAKACTAAEPFADDNLWNSVLKHKDLSDC